MVKVYNTSVISNCDKNILNRYVFAWNERMWQKKSVALPCESRY